MTEWINCSESLPDCKFKKYLVETKNGQQVPAFFMPDAIAWILYYGLKNSYWMAVSDGKLIHDVEKWCPL